jgi:hypothetical protein
MYQRIKIVPWLRSMLAYEIIEYTPVHITETCQLITHDLSNPASVYLIENEYDEEYKEGLLSKHYNDANDFIESISDNPAAISLITEEQFKKMDITLEQSLFMLNLGLQSSWLRVSHDTAPELKESIFGNPVLVDFIKEYLPHLLLTLHKDSKRESAIMAKIQCGLSENPAAVDILEANPLYVDKVAIQYNENAVPIIMRDLSTYYINPIIIHNMNIGALLKYPRMKFIFNILIKSEKYLNICTQNKSMTRILEKTRLPLLVKLQLIDGRYSGCEYPRDCVVMTY